MTRRDLQRAGAAAAVLGGALLAVGHVLDFAAWRAAEDASPVAGVMLHLAHLALVLGFIGAGIKLRRRRALAATVAIAGALGAGVVSAVHYVGLGQFVGMDASLLGSYAPVVVVGGLGVIALVGAFVTLGVAIDREGGAAGPSGSALVLGTVLMVGGLFELGVLVQTVGAVLIGTAMVWYGVEMWAPSEPAVAPSRARPVGAEITGELDTGPLAVRTSGT